MKTFKIQQQTFFEKIRKSGLLYVFIVVVLGVLVAFTVSQTQNGQIWIQKINRFSKTSSLQEKSQSSLSTQTESTEWSLPPPPEPSTGPVQSLNSSLTATTSQPTLTKVHSDKQIDIKISFYKISTEELNLLSQKTAELPSTVIIDEINLSLVSSEQFRRLKTLVLLKENTISTLENENKLLWIGSTNKATDLDALGLAFNFNYTHDQQMQTHTIKLVLQKLENNQPLKIPYAFESQAKEAVLIWGNSLLTYFEFNPQLKAQAPFSILDDIEFKNGQFQFLIAIEPLN